MVSLTTINAEKARKIRVSNIEPVLINHLILYFRGYRGAIPSGVSASRNKWEQEAIRKEMANIFENKTNIR